MSHPPLPLDPLASHDFDEIAAGWVWKRMRAPLSAEEQRQLEAWLSSDVAHAEAFSRASTAYERLGDMASAPEMMALRREALALEKKPPDIKVWTLGIAACLGLFFFLTTQFGGAADRERVAASIHGGASSQAQPAAPRDHYVTAVGERLTATLSDGSTLTLNTQSEVRIRYSDAARVIELVRGQAFFTVAHDADWPFLVTAGGQSVRALGTEFEVRLEGSKIEVVLVEGRVAVGASAAIERGDLRRAVELQAGERMAGPIGAAAYEVAPVDAGRLTSWRTGRLLLSSTSLQDAVAEMNRYRPQSLVIDDPEVAAMKISGAFRTADAQNFGAALSASLPVEERLLPDGRTLLVRRDKENAP